jgi:hypothetical protein
MLGKIINFIVGREPVATATGLAGGVAALVGVLSAFDVWRPSAEQTAAVGALVVWVAGYLARRAVTPVRALSDVTKAIEGLGNGERGGIWVALCVTAAVVFLLLFSFCALAAQNDEDSMAAANSPCEGSCEGKQGDCREVEEGGSCEDNDLSPSFQDSPVDHSFNPVICVLPDSCHFGP